MSLNESTPTTTTTQTTPPTTSFDAAREVMTAMKLNLPRLAATLGVSANALYRARAKNALSRTMLRKIEHLKQRKESRPEKPKAAKPAAEAKALYVVTSVDGDKVLSTSFRDPQEITLQGKAYFLVPKP